MKTCDLELTPSEKALLRSKKISQKSLATFSPDEVIAALDADNKRAAILQALIEFQRIPSIGLMFAKDLLRSGYYSLDAVKNKNGAKLFDAFETMNGYHTDPCVEDQFRLVVHYANNPESNKKWWDFTNERKAYRLENPYVLKY